jgi:hypothetical protein
MRDSWSCLSVENGPGLLSDIVRNSLKVAACDLHLKKWGEMRIESDVISGVIKTEWNTHSVGGQSGVLFRAQIDCEDGTDYKVNFLFNEDDLKQGAEIIRQVAESEGSNWEDSPTRFPVPELYQFYDLRGPSRRLH